MLKNEVQLQARRKGCKPQLTFPTPPHFITTPGPPQPRVQGLQKLWVDSQGAEGSVLTWSSKKKVSILFKRRSELHRDRHKISTLTRMEQPGPRNPGENWTNSTKEPESDNSGQCGTATLRVVSGSEDPVPPGAILHPILHPGQGKQPNRASGLAQLRRQSSRVQGC